MVWISRTFIAILLTGLGIGLAGLFMRSIPLEETPWGALARKPLTGSNSPEADSPESDSAEVGSEIATVRRSFETPRELALEPSQDNSFVQLASSTGGSGTRGGSETRVPGPLPPSWNAVELSSLRTEALQGVVHAVGTPASDRSANLRVQSAEPAPNDSSNLLESVSELINTIQKAQEAPARTPKQLAGEAEGTRNAISSASTSDSREPLRITKSSGEGDDQFSISFQDADIREVLNMLSQHAGVSIIALENVRGAVSGTLEGVDAMTALDAILKSKGFVRRQEGQFIYVGTRQDFEKMRRAKDQIGTRLYRPNYVKAADLESLITPILTTGVGTVSVSTSSEIGIGEDATSAGGDTFAGQEALLVRDYEQVLDEVDEIVARIDTRPMQVSIEAMILSVKIDDSNELGVDFELFRDKGSIRLVSGLPPSSLDAISATDSGLKVGFLDVSTSVFLNALEQVGDTSVIATPRLLCLNKHPAQIKIGAELGYVNQTLTPEGTIVPEVQFLDVGTQLRLRPFISSDGLVRMEVHPEISKGSVRVEDGLTLPDKETTEVTTNIIVRDGHTVVIGGLLRDEITQTASQIPFLGSMPLVGPLFRQNEEGIERQEILILITPRISYDKDLSPEGDIGAAEFHQRQAVYADKQIPFGRRYLGRKHLRLAQAAWNVGNTKRALRMVNLAIHFDPMSRAAIRMRSDLWEGNPPSAYANDPSTTNALQNPLDSERLPPWLLDSLENHQPYQPHHPLDAGRPGARHIIHPLGGE